MSEQRQSGDKPERTPCPKYPGKIINIIGGVHEYVGELDTLPHPFGPNWYRIREACQVTVGQNEQGQPVRLVSCIDGYKNDYRRYVDIRIPEDSIIEVREVNPDGALYKVYKNQLNQVKLDKIVAPDASDLQNVIKLQGKN